MHRHRQADFDRALAQALLKARALDPRSCDEVAREQFVVGGTFSLALWELGVVDAATLSRVGAELSGFPLAPRAEVERGAATVGTLLPREWLAEAGLLPYQRDGQQLQVASCWPWRLDRLDELRFRCGLAVTPRYLGDVELMRILARVHDAPVPRRYLGIPTPTAAVLASAAQRTGTARATEPAPELITETEFLSLYAGGEAEAAEAEPEEITLTAEYEPPDGDEIELVEALVEEAQAETPIASRQAAILALDQALDRQGVGAALVRFGRSRAPRVALFSCRGNVWLGWTGSGAGIDAARVAQLMVPTVPGTVFGLVNSAACPYVGPLARHPVHRSFLAALGGLEPSSVGMFPVHHRGRLLFVIYLDAGHAQRISPDVSDMLLVAQRLPAALERIVAARA